LELQSTHHAYKRIVHLEYR